jgi:hypothetical protein
MKINSLTSNFLKPLLDVITKESLNKTKGDDDDMASYARPPC